MTIRVWNRMIGIVGVSVVASLGLNGPTAAQPPPNHERRQQEDQKEAKRQQQAQKKEGKEQEKQARQDQQREQELAGQLRKAQDRQEQEQATHAQRRQQQERVNVAEQQKRTASREQQDEMRQQEQRLTQYKDHLTQHQPQAQPQPGQLRQQNRLAQVSVQQDYVLRLRQQQMRVEKSGRDGYGGGASSYLPPSYRYLRGGQYYETNKRGVDLLRQAVNYGYQDGCRAGLADRQDRWRSSIDESYAYRDANYGYAGYDVEREHYNEYFREGFRRGYEDGYQSRYRYGSYANGRVTILGPVLAAILTFDTIR